MAYDPLEMQRQKMSGYPNSETIGQENQQILAQNAAKAAAFAQAANQPAPVTQPNPEVAEFAQAKANNQANNSPRVAGQTGTVYNIFSRPAAEQKQVQQTVQTPAVTTPVNSGTTTPQNQPIRSMDDLAEAMGYTSPEQEEKLRKASVANQRIVAVADALRQIGNIYNTTRYAPSQQFNSPVEMERQRYLQGKMLRDKANQTYISYQQAKAAQDAKQRELDRQFARQREMDDWTVRKTEQQIKSQQEKDRRMEEMTAAKIAYQQGIIDDKEFNRKVKEYYMRLGLTPTGGALGGSRGRSGGSGSKPTQWQTRYNDYDYANQNGIPIMEETTDFLGNKTTKRRDPNVVHAEVEEHKRRNPGNNLGGGGQGRFSSLSIHKK